jgi:hypothetical protein
MARLVTRFNLFLCGYSWACLAMLSKLHAHAQSMTTRVKQLGRFSRLRRRQSLLPSLNLSEGMLRDQHTTRKPGPVRLLQTLIHCLSRLWNRRRVRLFPPTLGHPWLGPSRSICRPLHGAIHFPFLSSQHPSLSHPAVPRGISNNFIARYVRSMRLFTKGSTVYNSYELGQRLTMQMYLRVMKQLWHLPA